MDTGKLKLLGVAAILIGLSACQSTGNVPAGAGESSTSYDGKWAGKFRLMGGRYCTDYIKPSGEIRFDVINGRLKNLHTDMVQARLDIGYFAKDGTFYTKVQAAQAGRLSTIWYKGSVSGETLTGKFRLAISGCSGDFNLTKVIASLPNTSNTKDGTSEGIQQRLINLKSLIDQGLITEEEAAQKRKEILEGL